MGFFSVGANETGILNPAFDMLGQIANFIWPCKLPSPQELIRAVQAGQISPQVAGSGLRGNGIEFGAAQITRALAGEFGDLDRLSWGGMWRGVFDSQVSVASPGELLAMLNQKILNRTQFDRRMKLQGFWWMPYVDELVTLSQNVIPHPSDLVRFSVKDVWNPDVVRDFQYDAEFPAEFQYWMERQGMNGDARTEGQVAAGAAALNWPKAFWRSHWANLSPSHAYEMYQRLRPDRIGRYAQNLPGLRPFTLDNLKTILRINDYPVPFRDQLAAIAYHKPRLVDIDRFYRDGSIDREETYQLHLDLGYSPTDARMRTDWLAKREAARLTGVDTAKAVKLYGDLYEQGRLTYDEAFGEMGKALTGWYLLPNREDMEIEQGRTAWNQYGPQITQALALRIARQELAKSRTLLKAWRRQYLSGIVNDGQLTKDMLLAGYKGDYIDNFLRTMKAELASGRLLLSTSKIRRLFIEGIIPLETAENYLRNLGWKDPEIKYLMAQLQRDMQIEFAKVMERNATTKEKKEKALLRQLGAIERTRREAIRGLNRQATAPQLRKYYVRGIVTLDDFERELRRRLYDEENIKRQSQLARQERAKADEKRQRAAGAAGPGPGTGPGAGQSAPEAPPQQPVGQ